MTSNYVAKVVCCVLVLSAVVGEPRKEPEAGGADAGKDQVTY